MRSVLSIVAGVALLVGAVLVIREIAADDKPSTREQAIRKAERQTTGAYDCMPRPVRRRFDVALRRYDTRFGQVLDGLPDDTTPEEANRKLRADREIRRLRTRARAILLRYLPGGEEFDRECYARAVERFDRRSSR
jgi:hypothetical protein